MLESISSNNIFEYKKLTKEEQQQRGILGRLVGVMADSVNPTRNGRKYSAELWEKVFQSPIMKEKIENRVCFGEACHPSDGREEVDPEKVAICLAEVPKINNKGQLIGVFDVLDTPCGRILKTMLDYGANIGVSSRGSGDVIPDFNGGESVDPDTYDCICWDAVFIPAVKEARLKLVNESLEGKTLKQALTESLENSSEEERKAMQETIEDIYSNIQLKDNIDINDENLNIDEDCLDNMPVGDDKGVLEEQLQKTLLENNELANTITKLQERLSVSYAKGSELQGRCDSYLKIIKKLSEDNRKIVPLGTKIKSLNEQLEVVNDKLDIKNKSLLKSNRLVEKQTIDINSLTEELNAYKYEVKELNSLVESLKLENDQLNSACNNKIDDLKSNFDVKINNYESKLKKSFKLIEQYKSIAKNAVDKYIESQARILGVSEQEIKNRLTESYSFKEIDKVCDSLKEYKLNISKLPFRTSTDLSEDLKFKVTPSKKESILPADNLEDDIDDQLKSLAGLL